MPFVITTPTPTDTEDLILDGLSLNNSILGLSALACPPPRQRQEWIGAADSEHQALVRDPLYENRKVTATINVIPSGDMDAALDRIGEILDKLAASSKTQDGIELTWSPGGSTRTVTFDVLSGEIVEMPIDNEHGWELANAPEATVEMTCKPFWRGVEVLTAITSSSTPIVTAELVNNSGDVPALGKLIVTDTASQSRRHVEWGLEGPGTYNPATSLILDSDSLVTSGFAGTQTTVAGAYDPNATGNNAITCSLVSTSPTAVCGTGNQSHVGAFRVKARMQMSGDKRVRLSWQAGDGPFSSNGWVAPIDLADNSWHELDLGMITIPAVVSGTQRWTGRIEAYDNFPTGTINLDYLILIPVTAGYGKARATFSYSSGVLAGFDNFAGTTAGGNLNARSAVSGGTWATSGATTDFAFADDLSGEQVKRSTTADSGARWGILGSSNYTDVQIESLIYSDSTLFTGTVQEMGVVARWTDSSNYLRGMYSRYGRVLSIVQRVAGTDTTLASVTLAPGTFVSGVYYKLRLLVFASGRVNLTLLNTANSQLAVVEAATSVLATSGALQTGNPGIYDRTVGAAVFGAGINRYYDDFSVSIPAPEPVVLYSGRIIEFRHDGTEREDSTGMYWGQPQSYHPAGRFRVPVGTSRVLVKAKRNDIDATTDANVTDALQIQVGITPRGLAVPRA